MDNDKKTELKKGLEEHLGREAKPSEIGNAENDPLLMIRMLLGRIEKLEKEVFKL